MAITLKLTEHLYSIYKPFLDQDNHIRYKVLYGGRGGSKSTMIAKSLLIRGYSNKLRILCTREIQRSIKESVHFLLQSQIDILGLSFFYDVKEKSIVGKNGTEFIFEGLYRNIDSIKSMEKINICWVEEAHKVKHNSWKVLIPTIRNENSEIWVSFNPDEEDDPVYTMFVTTKRDDVYCKKINYYDNPYFPDVLRKEMEFDKSNNKQKYYNVWEGEPNSNYEANVYYNFNKNINFVDYDLEYNEGIETVAFWDFGVSPSDTAIGFAQILKVIPSQDNPRGLVINIFDEIIANNEGYEYYRKIVDDRHYLINEHYCDPAGKNRESNLQSWITNLARNPITKNNDWHFVYTYKYSRAEMISQANDHLPCVRINPNITPKFAEMFRKWKFKTDINDKVINPPVPLHDEFSHPGTAFYYFIVNRFPILKINKKILEI